MVAIVFASPALAADKLAIAPPSPWVTPMAVPTEDGPSDGAAIRMILTDEQVDLQPGSVTRFYEGVFKVQTPQGLPAGAVSLTWNPDTQNATVHTLKIRRGGVWINVLSSGQTFTVVRRETNLENSVLDGQLTASIQPEGLQVGDVIDFAASITTRDPALGMHVEHAGAAWNTGPIDATHLHIQWPSSVALRIQPDGGLPQPKVTRRNGMSSFDVTMDHVQPLVLPKGAPIRYQYGRLIEVSDLASWGDAAALMAPLYEKAAALPATSAVRAEIGRIMAASSDPKAQAQAALTLVQERVRYVFLGINDGGLVPADAETTWSRRFGDCKGKTVLLLALLHGLGIEAHPVLVSSRLGDGLDRRLPQLGLFDHVLVQATIGGRVYWLDGTRVGDTDLDQIETPYFRWGLPLVAGTRDLVPMVPPPPAKPQTDIAIRIDATGSTNVPAPIRIERTVRGDEAVATQLALSNLVGDAHDAALREFFKERYDFAEPKTVSAAFDPARRELRFTMDGSTKMDWNDGWYEADHVWVGYKADFSRDAGPDRDAPYGVSYPTYTHVVETILLPMQSATFTIAPGAEVDQTVAGIEYHRHAHIAGDRFVVEESDRSVAPEFPAIQAEAAQEKLRALAKSSVYLGRSASHAETQDELEAIAKSDPSTVPDMLKKASVLINNDREDQGLALVAKVLALQPKNAQAYATRVLADLDKGDRAAAKADLDRAVEFGPEEVGTLIAKGRYAHTGHDYASAIAAYSAALAEAPGDPMTLFWRAHSYAADNQNKLSLEDAAAAIKAAPYMVVAYQFRANMLFNAGDSVAAGNEADALKANNPQNGYALVLAGRIYAASGRLDDAMRAFDAAIAIKPESYIYVNRAEIRRSDDIAGRKADLEEAVHLDPQSKSAQEATAALLGTEGDWKGAATILTSLVAADPTNIRLLSKQGAAYLKVGDEVAAGRSLIAAEAHAQTTSHWNSVCWTLATAGVALDRALSACDRALALTPDSHEAHDSRGFTLLRLGRSAEAIAEYDKALDGAPSRAWSRYGRALAEAQKGDLETAQRDAALASRTQPRIADEFAAFGLTIPAVPKAPANRSAVAE